MLSVQTPISLIRLALRSLHTASTNAHFTCRLTRPALCSLYKASTNVHFTCRLTCPAQIPYKAFASATFVVSITAYT